jgi:hypothetical protein
MDQRLRRQHNSCLHQIALEQGLIPSFKWSFDICEQAILAYWRKHKKGPATRSGDASEFLGLPPGTQTWMNMELWLRRNHQSSLGKMKQFLGLNLRGKTFTE